MFEVSMQMALVDGTTKCTHLGVFVALHETLLHWPRAYNDESL